MRQKPLTRLFVLLLCVLALRLAQAQVITDGSLGPAQSLTGPDFAITADLGQQRGSNLFHSFSQLNISATESATFSGPAEIQSIIARVTGGNVSTIDGLLRSDIDGADLIELNPAGFLFGSNALLDLSGNVVFTTAGNIRFQSADTFFAFPQQSEVLSVASIASFGFLSVGYGSIDLNGTSMALDGGKTISLFANGVTLGSALLQSSGGQIAIAAVGSGGEIVSYATDVDVSSFNTLGDILFNASAQVDVSGAAAGSVFVRGRNVTVDNAGIHANVTGTGGGGLIDIDTTETFLLQPGALITAESTAAASAGTGGRVNVHTNAFTAGDGSLLSTASSGARDGGMIDINVDTSLFVNGSAIIRSNALSTSTGDAGYIKIAANSLTLNDTGKISADSSGAGDAGYIDIAANSLTLNDTVESRRIRPAPRDAGYIDIAANSLTLNDTSKISADSSGAGNSGMIYIVVDGAMTVRDSAMISSDVLNAAAPAGISGQTRITSDSLIVSDNGSISSATAGAKTGGGINIDVNGSVSLTAGGKVSSDAHGDGNSGDVVVLADRLTVEGAQSSISSSTVGDGNAGNIDLAVGTTLRVTDQAKIESNTSGAGNSGSLDITATEVIVSGPGSGISTSTSGSGNAADIRVTANRVVVQETDGFSSSSTSTTGGAAGNVTINVADSFQYETDTAGTLLADVLGTGTFTKLGAGVLTTTGASTSTGPTNVDAGTLNVLGSIAGTVHVNAGAMLSGTGTVGNTIVHSGATVAPGNSPGILNVNGDYVQNAGSTYSVEIDSAGSVPGVNHDQIAVTGTATLNGGTVSIEAAPGTYAPETEYTILTATGGVAGNFQDATLVSGNVGGLNLFLLHGSDNVVLRLTEFESLLAVSAGESLATVSQFGIQLGSLQFQTLSNQIHQIFDGGSSLVASAPISVAAEPSPLQLVSYVDSAGCDAEVASCNTCTHRSQCCCRCRRPCNTWEGYVIGYGTSGNVQGDGASLGLDYGAGGTQLGLYRRDRSTSSLFGLFGGYAHQNVDTSAQGLDVDGGQIGTFLATSASNNGYYIAAVSYSQDSYDSARATPTGVAASDFDGNRIGVFVERCWQYDVADRGIWLQPYAALQYLWQHQNDVTETGAAVNNVTFDDINTHSAHSSLGCRLFKRVRCDDHCITAEINGDWTHEYADTDTLAAFSAIGASFSAPASTWAETGRDWVRACRPRSPTGRFCMQATTRIGIIGPCSTRAAAACNSPSETSRKRLPAESTTISRELFASDTTRARRQTLTEDSSP